jgi:hypothetical protein
MTPKAHARFVVLFGVVAGASAALAPACSLDWQVRADPGDGALPESRPPDVTVADTATDAPDDGPIDSPPDPDASECATLAANVAKAKAKAKECELSMGQCTTTVLDECDCKVVVKAPGTPQNTAYADAIAALLAKCGKPSPKCDGACAAVGLPAGWACLQPGASPVCTPPIP